MRNRPPVRLFSTQNPEDRRIEHLRRVISQENRQRHRSGEEYYVRNYIRTHWSQEVVLVPNPLDPELLEVCIRTVVHFEEPWFPNPPAPIDWNTIVLEAELLLDWWISIGRKLPSTSTSEKGKRMRA